MSEKFNENTKVEKFTNLLGIAVRLSVIDPFHSFLLYLPIYIFPFQQVIRASYPLFCPILFYYTHQYIPPTLEHLFWFDV